MKREWWLQERPKKPPKYHWFITMMNDVMVITTGTKDSGWVMTLEEMFPRARLIKLGAYKYAMRISNLSDIRYVQYNDMYERAKDDKNIQATEEWSDRYVYVNSSSNAIRIEPGTVITTIDFTVRIP